MSRRTQKKRRAANAQRELFRTLAAEESEAVLKLQRELDQLAASPAAFLSIPQPDFQGRTGAQVLEHVADCIAAKMEGGEA